MAEQTRNREFGEAEVARYAGEGMAEHMGSHILELHPSANAVEYSDHTNEMPVSPVGRKDEGRPVARRLGFDAVHRRFAQHSDLCATLGIRKSNAMFASTEPGPLKAKCLHPPESREEHEPDCGESGRVFTFGRDLAHHASEVANFAFAQSALPLPYGELSDTFRRIPRDDPKASGVAEQCS